MPPQIHSYVSSVRPNLMKPFKRKTNSHFQCQVFRHSQHQQIRQLLPSFSGIIVQGKRRVALGPAHSNTFSFENAYNSTRLGLPSALIRIDLKTLVKLSRSKRKSIHIILVQTVENASNEKDDRKYRRSVCLQHVQRVQLTSQRAILYRFVDSRDRMKTVLWTRIDRCVFGENENALVWTGQQQIKRVLVPILFAKCHKTVVNWREKYFRKFFLNFAMSMIAICDSHDYKMFCISIRIHWAPYPKQLKM